MAETRFIRTVAFGGYDKSDVDKRLEAMYSKVHDLKNELTETKAVLKKYEEGSDAAKSYESVLAVERAKITQLQVKNDNLSEKIKTVRDSIKIKEDENTCLREKNAALEAEIEDLKLSLMTIKVGEDAAALGTVFVEAQKSKEMVLKSAQNEADNIKAMSERSAEDTIADANNKAKEIIYEAEKKAAEITADAHNNSEEMKTASNNLKAVLASDIFKISEYFSKLKDVLHDFEVDSSAALEQSQELLKDAEKEVNKDGIPVFRLPERIEPAYPEKPDIKPVFESEQEVKEKKRNTELDKLQAMAEAIGRSEKKSDKSTDNSTEQSDNSTDKKPESEQDTKTSSDSETSAKKPASNNAPSLADLLKQATALNGGKN